MRPRLPPAAVPFRCRRLPSRFSTNGASAHTSASRRRSSHPAAEHFVTPKTSTPRGRMVREGLGMPNVTSHSFRKTVATLIDDAGLSARIGVDHLGHAKVSMTQDRYMSRGRVHNQVADLLDRAVADKNDDLYLRRRRKPPLTSAPGTTRTCDLGIRRPLLYPPELRRQCAGQSIEQRRWIGSVGRHAHESPSRARVIGYGVGLDTRTTSVGKQLLTATERVPDVEGWR